MGEGLLDSLLGIEKAILDDVGQLGEAAKDALVNVADSIRNLVTLVGDKDE